MTIASRSRLLGDLKRLGPSPQPVERLGSQDSKTTRIGRERYHHVVIHLDVHGRSRTNPSLVKNSQTALGVIRQERLYRRHPARLTFLFARLLDVHGPGTFERFPVIDTGTRKARPNVRPSRTGSDVKPRNAERQSEAAFGQIETERSAILSERRKPHGISSVAPRRHRQRIARFSRHMNETDSWRPLQIAPKDNNRR